MTKSDAYFYRLAMPRPFAKGNGAALTPIAANGLENKVNFLDGFPTPYSAPASDGGRFVTRGEMNAIGNLASQNQFYFLAGGINTFDDEFCMMIGGYPEGAILDKIELGVLRKVVSLIDNNKVNFNGSSTTEGITNGWVDGTSWQYIDSGDRASREPTVISSVKGMTVTRTLDKLNNARMYVGTMVLAGTFVSPASGYVSLTNTTTEYGEVGSVYSWEITQYAQSVKVGFFLGSLFSMVKVFPSGSQINSPIITMPDANGQGDFSFDANGFVNIGFGSSTPRFMTGSFYGDGTHTYPSVTGETPISSGAVSVSAGNLIVVYLILGAIGYDIPTYPLYSPLQISAYASATVSFDITVL